MEIKIFSEISDLEVLEIVKKVLEETYEEKVQIEFVGRFIDESTLNKERGQHDAWKIVERYVKQRRRDEYLLLIVEEDLYVEKFNYIFGLAWNGVAIVSTYRLKQEFYGYDSDRQIFIERLIKEVVHEIGHLHNLTHCNNKKCVMAFSNWIGDTDYKSWTLCQNCRMKIMRKSR